MKLFSVLFVTLITLLGAQTNNNTWFFPSNGNEDQQQLYSTADSNIFYSFDRDSVRIYNNRDIKHEYLVCNVSATARIVDIVAFNTRERESVPFPPKSMNEWLNVDLAEYYYANIFNNIGIDTALFLRFYNQLANHNSARLYYRDQHNGVVVNLNAYVDTEMPDFRIYKLRDDNSALTYFLKLVSIILIVSFYCFLFCRARAQDNKSVKDKKDKKK